MKKGQGAIPGLLFLCLNHFMPKSLAILFLLPCFVVGMPVAFAMLRFALVIPNALFQLKDNPGISDFFLAIVEFSFNKMATFYAHFQRITIHLLTFQRIAPIGNTQFVEFVNEKGKGGQPSPFGLSFKRS